MRDGVLGSGRGVIAAGLFGVFAVFGGESVAGTFTYQADTGGNADSSLTQFDANATWGNYFQAEPGFETITAISFAFARGFDGAGRSLELLVYDDLNDDGDPTDAVLVSQTNAAAVLTPDGEPVEYAIDAVTVSGGFFIAVNMDAFQNEPVFRADTSVINPMPSTTSWTFYNPVGTPQLDLGSSLFIGFNGDFGLGSWVVRAVALPGPGSGGVLAVLAVLGVSRRRR